MPPTANPCGVDLFDGVPLGRLWMFYSAVGERHGLEPHKVPSYMERDWLKLRKKARRSAIKK